MTPEQQLTAAVVRRLKELRADGRRIWWAKLAGGPMQQRGLPDLLIVYNGRAVFAELKAGRNGPTRLQSIRIDDLRAAGAAAAVCLSLIHI